MQQRLRDELKEKTILKDKCLIKEYVWNSKANDIIDIIAK